MEKAIDNLRTLLDGGEPGWIPFSLDAGALPGFTEFNIGHSIVSRALLDGMREAVAQMKALMRQHAPGEETR